MSLLTFSFTDSGILVLYKSRGLTDYCAGSFSLTTGVNDGGGEVDTRSMTSSGVVVVFAFFGRASGASASRNH